MTPLMQLFLHLNQFQRSSKYQPTKKHSLVLHGKMLNVVHTKVNSSGVLL